jgi:outer membrane protein
MKRSLALIVTLASGFVLSAAAQTLPAPTAAAAPAGPTKIAVIAFQAAVQQTNEFQRNLADLEKKYAPRQAQLKALDEEMNTLAKKLQDQGSVLSDNERASITKSIDEKKKKFDRDAEDLKNDGGQEVQEMFIKMISKVGDVMVTYAQQQGYTLILDASQQPQQMLSVVLWTTPSTDITTAIIDAYNVKSGVPAPPAPPAAAARPAAARPAAPKPPAAR